MMRARLLVPFLAASCAALAGIGDGFGLGDNGGFDGPSAAGGGLAGDPSPTFDLVAGATTPNDLPDTLTVNSVSMTLVLACDAQGVSGTSWTCRDASGAVVLTEAGTGSSPTSSTLTPFHATDLSERVVRYVSGGKTHAAATSAPGTIAAQDFAIEAVIRPTPGASGTYFAKRSGTNAGFSMQKSTTNFYTITLTDGVNTLTTGGITLSNGTFAHLMVFGDRNGGATGLRSFTNGALSDSSNFDIVGNMSGSDVFTFAALSQSATATAGADIISLRIFVCPVGNEACFATSNNDAIARQRAATAFGVSPIIARGTAAPTTLTRATTAHVDVVDGTTRQLYLVGNNAPRVARRTSQGSPIAGYLSEPAVSNIALQSQTLGTTWTAITVGDNVLADAFAGADLTATGDNIDGNNSNAEHGLRQSITVTATSHTFSAWAKTGTQNFVALRNATVANGTAWFDVATCTSSSCTIGEDCASAVGTVQAGVTRASAERYPVDTTGDGVADVNLCRVAITYTGTAAAHNHDLLCAPSNGVTTYTDADATADCGFWGVRVEAYPMPTSYLATTTASTARNADDLRFDGASHYTGSPTTMDVAVLCPNFDSSGGLNIISVGASGTDFFGLRTISSGADRRPNTVASVVTGQWDITGPSPDIYNGVFHSIRVAAATNNITLYADSVPSGTDTLATMPTVASSVIYFGALPATPSPPNCLINRARLWSSLVAP